MKIGILGLPNVGKSTLFNALTESSLAEAANYPFCTIDPNTGIVEVPDIRLENLARIVSPQKIIPAITEFVDIAGLVKGASKGEGLGNKFLSHVRECDALCHVLRVFKNASITHTQNTINPKNDKEIIETELILADLQTVEKKLATIDKEIRTQGKEGERKKEVIQKLYEILSQGKKANNFLPETEEDKKTVRDLFLLTVKPMLYVCNVSDEEVASFNQEAYKKLLDIEKTEDIVPISAQTEQDIAPLPPAEKQEFLQEFGIEKSGRTELIQKAYKLLGLETYFTAGEKEVRAWTFKKGMTAPQCAGIIHTDFEKGFICADVISYEDFMKYKGFTLGKEYGAVKMQGKEYGMQDGDICLFKFSS
jgi:GTP-binding protein YchF